MQNIADTARGAQTLHQTIVFILTMFLLVVGQTEAIGADAGIVCKLNNSDLDGDRNEPFNREFPEVRAHLRELHEKSQRDDSQECIKLRQKIQDAAVNDKKLVVNDVLQLSKIFAAQKNYYFQGVCLDLAADVLNRTPAYRSTSQFKSIRQMQNDVQVSLYKTKMKDFETLQDKKEYSAALNALASATLILQAHPFIRKNISQVNDLPRMLKLRPCLSETEQTSLNYYISLRHHTK